MKGNAELTAAENERRGRGDASLYQLPHCSEHSLKAIEFQWTDLNNKRVIDKGLNL